MRELDLDAVGERQLEPPQVTIGELLNRASRAAGPGDVNWNSRYKLALNQLGLHIIPDPGFRPLPVGMVFAPLPFNHKGAWSDGSVIVRVPWQEHYIDRFPSAHLINYPFTLKMGSVNGGAVQS